MSELKTYKMVDEKYCADCVCVIPSEVYLKSEADKVITELKAQKAQAEDDCAYWKTMSRKSTDDNEVMAKQRANAFKRERHQKYKRCLAMAYVEWLKQVIIGLHPESILYRKVFKRERKWKELAEKFKEGK